MGDKLDGISKEKDKKDTRSRYIHRKDRIVYSNNGVD